MVSIINQTNIRTSLIIIITIMILVSGLSCSNSKKKTPSGNNELTETTQLPDDNFDSLTPAALIEDFSEDESFNDLVNSIKATEFPLDIDRRLFENLEEKEPLNETYLSLLRVKDIFGYHDGIQCFIHSFFKTEKGNYAVLVIQDYSEESGILIMIFSKTGELLDYLNVYYDNSEGSISTKSVLENEITIIRTQYSIYEKNKPEPEIFLIQGGCFTKKGINGHDVDIKIGELQVSAYFPVQGIRRYDVEKAFEKVEEGSQIKDIALIKTFWPEESESYRMDTVNSKAYFYSYSKPEDNITGISVLYSGGCSELWFFVIDDVSGKIIGKFTLSETCASDAEDYSSGIFLGPADYEKTATWINEYPEEGETPFNEKITSYKISNAGVVSEEVK